MVKIQNKGSVKRGNAQASPDNTGNSVKNFNNPMEELQFNVEEEDRLTTLIRDPPIEFRKHK